MASEAIISDTTRPAPLRFTRRRNGKSVTPDMGARITGSSIETEPIVMLIFCTTPGVHSCWSLRSEEHTSELQSLMRISYAVFCLKKKKTTCTYVYKPTVQPQHIHKFIDVLLNNTHSLHLISTTFRSTNI